MGFGDMECPATGYCSLDDFGERFFGIAGRVAAQSLF
jgi:hypothetical protein